MTQPVQKRAGYEDVLAAPEHLIAQVLDGELHLQPRPAAPHALAASAIGEELGPPFKRGRGGPGGWLILDEPELHLGPDVLVPDLAGWRRERVPSMPETPFMVTPPDWVCEVLSPSTVRVDRIRKSRIYVREQVPYLWLVDPEAHVLEVLQLDGDTYRIIMNAEGEERVRAAPFDAIELDLGILWKW